ncbi:MAG: bifunctional metallophosphatase/5'-nucleotidase [Chloroflexi bacterium]|nr:MAG: bifunctional metallophosphatase/5'-nucleotidase [Chloroflexota bacterium]
MFKTGSLCNFVPRFPTIGWFGLIFGLLWGVACQTVTPTVPSSTTLPTVTIETPVATVASPVATMPSAQVTAPPETADSIRELTILYTNDEHGWLAGMRPEQSAAHLVGLWQAEHGYEPDGAFLLISGGDMWTGPAISTWFQGESMADIMNAMGYAAAAVGNHEFDFGLDTLRLRAEQSHFPFLSANIRYRSDNSSPTDVGILPFTITTVNDIQVGLIGLTTVRTPTTTNPNNVADFVFLDYETALREVVPQVRAAGAEMIVVPAHICQSEMMALAEAVADLGISLLGGGHCNELFATERNGMVLLEGGFHLTSYAYATFQFDTDADRVVEVRYGTGENVGGTAVPHLATLIQQWQTQANAELNQIIGFTTNGIPRRSIAMQALITHAWLSAYPTANVAITNLGGMRASIPPGDITLADIIGVMPFDNVIVEVRLTGEQLIQTLDFANGQAAIGGARRVGGEWILTSNNEPIRRDGMYSLLVNDFMYAGGDGYGFLAEFNPDGYNTAIDWRQPVIDWIEAQASSPERPLDATIEALTP